MNIEEFDPFSSLDNSFIQNWVNNNPDLKEGVGNTLQEQAILDVFVRLKQEMDTRLFCSVKTLNKAVEDLNGIHKDYGLEKARNVINQFHKHLQKHTGNSKTELEFAEEKATCLVKTLLESALKPPNIDVEDWKAGITSEVRQKLTAYLAPMIVIFGVDQEEEECRQITEEVAFQIAPLIYKQKPYPYEKLEAFFKYQLSKNVEEISKSALIVYAEVVKEDKALLRKENEPLIAFFETKDTKLPLGMGVSSKSECKKIMINIFERALNGPTPGSLSLEDLIKSLSRHKNATLIDFLIIKFKEFRKHRKDFLEKQRAINVEYYSPLLERIAQEKKEVILKERGTPFIFQKEKSWISFRDLQEMEGGRYLGSRLWDLISDVDYRPSVQREWKNVIEDFLIKGANGISEGSVNPIEHFLQKIVTISPSDSQEIPEEKIRDLVDEALVRYNKIKKDRDLLVELKIRTASAQGISQRWTSALSRVQPPDHLDEEFPKTPQHMRINAWALRHFARVSPGKGNTVKNTMILDSTHQTNQMASYFRTELTTPSNRLMSLLKDNTLTLLEQGDKIKKEEVFFFNNPNMRKTLELQNEYIDLDKLSDQEAITIINKICDQIDDENSPKLKQFLFVFDLRLLTSQPTKGVGEKLVETAEHWKKLIKGVLDTRMSSLEKQKSGSNLGENRKLVDYYSRIVLAGIAELDPPLIFAPQLDERSRNDNSILKAIIVQQGFTPTMQSTTKIIAKYSPFAKIKPSGIDIAQKPDYRFYVESLSDLCKSPIFTKFKEMGKSAIAKEVGVDFLIEATTQLVESLNDKENTLMSRFRRTGEISTLRESFGLVLAAMDEANSFKLGLLDRDIADFSRIKEHVMDQVLMWLDDPLPDQSEASKMLLMKKRLRLEKLIAQAQFKDTLTPDFCQFTTGGMNCLSNIVRGLIALKGKERLSVGNFVNCYYETLSTFEDINKADKIVNAGKIKAFNYLDDIKEMIYKIKNKPLRMTECQNKIMQIKMQISEAEEKLNADSTQRNKVDQMKEMLGKMESEFDEIRKIPDALDAFFVDLHPSPNVTEPIIKPNNIKEVMKLILESGITSPMFTFITDSTISELYSVEINEIILEHKDKINIIVFNSCQKFESIGSDRLTGGFLSLFTKNKSFLNIFENFKKEDTVDPFNVDGFIHLYTNLSDKIAAHRKKIFDNTELLFSFLNPKFVYNGTPTQKVAFSRKEDKGNYYFFILINSSMIDAGLACEDLHKRFLEEGIPLLERQSFGFIIPTVDGIGNHIRIKTGHGNLKLLKKQASLIENFFLDICRRLNYDPLAV